MTLYGRQGSRPSPGKRSAKRQNGCRRGLTKAEKRSERQRRKGKIYPLESEFQRIARRDKKALLSDQKKKKKKKTQRKRTEWERLEVPSRKLEIPREHFMQRWLSNIPPSVYNTVYLLIY